MSYLHTYVSIERSGIPGTGEVGEMGDGWMETEMEEMEGGREDV